MKSLIDEIGQNLYYSIQGDGLLPSLLRYYIYLIFSILYEPFHHEYSFFTLKRLFVVFILGFLGIPLCIIWNHIGFLLDDVFYPDWKHILVKKPIFIIGNARSGTTWLHRLLTKADKHQLFTTFLTWELLVGASITWSKLFLTLHSIDVYVFDSFFLTSLLHMEKRMLGKIDIHQVGLMHAEEDEWLMSHIGAAQLLCFLFPLGTTMMNKLILFDLEDSLSESFKLTVLGYYKKCIKKRLFVRFGYDTTPPTIFVSKNPSFTLRVSALTTVFPDCRFICLLRDPVQSVPSMVSYISSVRDLFASPRHRYPNASELVGFCVLHYVYPIKYLNESGIPHEQWMFVKYRDLIETLEPTVLKVVDKLELLGSGVLQGRSKDNILNEFRKFLSEEANRAKKYQSSHQYSVEECCNMSTHELKHSMNEVYQMHHFD